MKRLNLVVTSTLLAVGLASTTGVWAKPGSQGGHGKANHGQTVSSAARSKSDSDTNHGKTVSEVARSKNNKGKNKTKDRDDREDGDTRSDRVKQAARTRAAAIQAAQRTYQERRARILSDGDRDDKFQLTREQRRQLEDAKDDRDRAIRQAHEQYRLTVRRTN